MLIGINDSSVIEIKILNQVRLQTKILNLIRPKISKFPPLQSEHMPHGVELVHWQIRG